MHGQASCVKIFFPSSSSELEVLLDNTKKVRTMQRFSFEVFMLSRPSEPLKGNNGIRSWRSCVDTIVEVEDENEGWSLSSPLALARKTAPFYVGISTKFTGKLELRMV